MPDYRKMYTLLFNGITDALHLMEQDEIEKAELVLKESQCQTEEMYISSYGSGLPHQ